MMRIILYPLALAYTLAVTLRNKLFDWKILREQTFAAPVICVGNLAVGGTGKTPHIEWLISLLKDKYDVAVLSRGYRRRTKGYVLADETSSAQSIGDEPFQIKMKFLDITVAVDSNRRRGIKRLLQSTSETTEKQKLILLDDAFQHRYVKPSLSILLTDHRRLYTRDLVLPAGRLREPRSGVKRADIIIVTKCRPDTDFPAIKKEIICPALYFSTYQYHEIKPVFTDFNHKNTKTCLAGKMVLLLTGIVSPQPLHAYLSQHAAKVVPVNFPDHHDFSQKDINRVSDIFDKMGGEKIIVTTEKDAARLVGNAFLSEKMKKFVYSIGVEVVILQDRAKELEDNILCSMLSRGSATALP